MTTYRRRTSSSRPNGPRANRYPGLCIDCGVNVPAGAGLLERSSSGEWVVRHRETRWVGSPTSGRWSGGCEDPPRDYRPARSMVGRTSSGAEVLPYRRAGHRCEDAPCCGCCS